MRVLGNLGGLGSEQLFSYFSYCLIRDSSSHLKNLAFCSD